MDRRKLTLGATVAQLALACLAHSQEAKDGQPELATAKPGDLIGTWERRDQFGSAGRTVTAELKFDTGGGGEIKIVMREGEADDPERKVTESMAGVLNWRLDRRVFAWRSRSGRGRSRE